MTGTRRRLLGTIGGLLGALTLGSGAARAEDAVRIGVTIPLTGPAAILGQGAKNAISLMPDNAGGVPVTFTILDDASDTTASVVNAKRLIGEGVDVIIGSSTTPQSLAMLDTLAAAKIPAISLASSRLIVEPVDDKRRWVFKTNPNDNVLGDADAAGMVRLGAKTAAIMAQDDAFGTSYSTAFKAGAEKAKLDVVATEKFQPRDTAVTAQVLKVMAAKPDAVLIIGTGLAAALPASTLRERGYRGRIFLTAASVSAEFLKMAGKAVEGAYVNVGPCLVWEQLPADNPVKPVCADFIPRYEAKFGAGSRNLFVTQGYDFWHLLEVAIPAASKTGAKPGTPEYRIALRDALETSVKEHPGNTGVYTVTPTDHVGLDQRAVVLVDIQDGNWHYAK